MAGFVVPTVEEVISSRKEQSSYSELRFPDDLGPHAIVFNFSDYSFDRSANTVSTVTTSSICLPIPSELRDTFSLRLAGTELGVFGNLARDMTQTWMNSKDTGEAFKNILASDQLGEGIIGKTIRSAIASSDAAVVKGVESALGTIVNPHLALTFDGIDLKTHSFSWTLAPSSSTESVRLAKIIKTIKASILPSYKKDAGRTFLQYPKVVDVFFLGSEPGHLYFFKRCMVSSFETNYAAAGTPAFLPNGRPAFVTMAMALTEMEIHTAEDYTGEAK